MTDFFVDTKFHVRYAETDAMGIVHHSSYIVWFEEGRSEFMRQIGLPYSKVEDMGFYFSVLEVNARYISPAVYDDIVVVRTRLVEVKSRKLAIRYEVLRDADGKLLAEGNSLHICLNREFKIARMPQELFDLLKKHCVCDG